MDPFAYYTELTTRDGDRTLLWPNARTLLASKVFLDALSADVLRAMPEDVRQRLEDQVYVGKFPTGDFNAQALRVPGGGYVFLINVGLMMLIYDAAKVVFSQAAWQAGKRWTVGSPRTELQMIETAFKADGDSSTTDDNAHVLSFDAAAKRLQESIRSYVRHSEWHPASDPEHFVIQGRSQTEVLTTLVEAAERFVVAHEFAHAMLGHLENAATALLAVPQGKQPIYELQKTWMDEIAADANAVILLIFGAPRQLENPSERLLFEMALAGPLFFLAVGGLIEEETAEKPRTHPPAVQRRQALREWLSKKLPQPAFSLADCSVQMLEQLWRSRASGA